MAGCQGAEFRFASLVFNDQNAARSMCAGPGAKTFDQAGKPLLCGLQRQWLEYFERPYDDAKL